LLGLKHFLKGVASQLLPEEAGGHRIVGFGLDVPFEEAGLEVIHELVDIFGRYGCQHLVLVDSAIAQLLGEHHCRLGAASVIAAYLPLVVLVGAVQPYEDQLRIVAAIAGLGEGIYILRVLFRHNEDQCIIRGVVSKTQIDRLIPEG
jgi:hypothetical protein